jgi:hypothetical protein
MHQLEQQDTANSERNLTVIKANTDSVDGLILSGRNALTLL